MHAAHLLKVISSLRQRPYLFFTVWCAQIHIHLQHIHLQLSIFRLAHWQSDSLCPSLLLPPKTKPLSSWHFLLVILAGQWSVSLVLPLNNNPKLLHMSLSCISIQKISFSAMLTLVCHPSHSLSFSSLLLEPKPSKTTVCISCSISVQQSEVSGSCEFATRRQPQCFALFTCPLSAYNFQALT
jgi:hypothetical protein